MMRRRVRLSADEKLKSLSKGQGSRPTNQVSPAAAGSGNNTPERLGRREVVSTDPQSKARHRSRSEGPRRGERQRLFEKNDSQGPQWAVSHEPRRSPRPLCLRQFSDDDIPEVNQSASDTDSGDSGPKRWTRNPLLIKKTKKVEKTRATEWKKTVPDDDNKSQTMPTSIGRANVDSPSSPRQAQAIPNTWSNPDRISSASPKGKFQRLEEMRQQRMEVYPTSDEEGNPHSEISNQIRQRLSQVQAGRGRGRKSSLGEYDGVENRSGPEYTNYLKNAGDQIILEPKLKSEVQKPAPMTASFPSYRPMSTAFTGGNGSLSPTVTSRRDSMSPSQPEKTNKPRMVVVEYPRKNQQNGGISTGFKLDPKYDSSSPVFGANIRNEGRNQAAYNPNRNSTAVAFGNNIQCIIPSQQQQQYQQQPPMLPPRQQPIQQHQQQQDPLVLSQPPLLRSQSPLLQPHVFPAQQQPLLQPHQEPSLSMHQPLLLQQQQSLPPKKQEPLQMHHQQQSHQTAFSQPSVPQRQSLLQQHEQQLQQLQLEHQQQIQQIQQQQQQFYQQQQQQQPLPPQQLFVQPDNIESTDNHMKQFGASSPLPSYHPISFQPLPGENGLDICPPPAEFKTPEKQEPKLHRAKNSGSQKRHSRAEPISVGATNSDGGMLLHVPARHIPKSYSDGDSLDELLESNMPYLESGSEINTLQLHRHSMKVIEDSLNGTTTTTTITDTICMTSQPPTPDLVRPTPIIPSVQPQQTTSPVPPPASVPVAPAPQMPAPQVSIPEPVSKIPESTRPLVTDFSQLPTSASSFPQETKLTAPTKPFDSSDLGFIDYKPIITISESLLVSESNKTKRSVDSDRKPVNDNHLSSPSTPSTVSSQTQNTSPLPGLTVPMQDTGMFSDVEYDIEVSERVKKWEKYMKTPLKSSPTDAKPTDLAGDNHLATTVKDMACEWSKYLSVIEEDTPVTKPYTVETPTKPTNKTSAMSTPRKNSLEAQKKVNLTVKTPTQAGSISDGDMYKVKSPYTPTLGATKSLLQVTPIQDTSSVALSRSYHEGAPTKSLSLDSPLFIPARNFSNTSPVSDTSVPARSPVANKEYEFFSPQNRNSLSLHSTDSKITALRSDQQTPDLFEITKMSENVLRRKSDTQAMRVSSQLSPRSTALSEQCNWKNLIGDIQGKLKDTEIWSPQMDSHQGPVSIERVTARTLETIPFSEDPFWKEIEELTNFDQLMKDLPSDPKSPPPPQTSRSKVFPPPESTTTSCYQVSMVSSQPSNNYSLSSLLSSLTEATAPTKSYSTSNLKTSFKSDGMNALDEVLLDLQPVLGNRLTPTNQSRRYGSSTDMSNTSSPRRPVSYHASNYTSNRPDTQNLQELKTMIGSTSEVKDSSFSNISQLQQTHSSMTYQSMTNLVDKQYENVVNGNYQLDPSVLKEKLINTGLVERSPSGEDLALLMKNSKSTTSNVLVAVKETETPVIFQPPAEENIEELKILARQVEDKLSEIKTKILKADDNNLDKMLTTLKTFSPSTSAMLSANVQTPMKGASRDCFVTRKAKLNDAISELEKIYDKLNLGSEVYLEHARSTEFPSSLTGQESHGFRLSSSFSQLYESSQSHQTNSDTFHSDIRFLSSSDHGVANNHNYGELTQVPVKDVGSEYPVKISTSAPPMASKMEEATGDVIVSNNTEVPTRRSRTRRQRRAAMVNESNQESRRARSSVNKDDNDAPRAYITSVTVERSPRSKSSVRADGLDGGSSRQANGSRRPKPPPRSSSLHRKAGRDEERSRRKSTPPDFDLKQGNNDALSQSSNSQTEPAEESRLLPKMMHHLQQQRQELSGSSDSSAETIQKKRSVSKSIAKMVDLFSSSDEERHKMSRSRPICEQPPMSEICEDTTEKFSDESRSSKSSPKSQPSGKIMTPRSVKQRHDAKRQKAALAQQAATDTCSAAVSDDTPATEDSSAASKPPLPLRRQRSQSSEKYVSSSEDNAADDGPRSETHTESSHSERNVREKSSPTPSNASRNRWSISSARELMNTSDSSISSEQVSAASGKVVVDRAERCRSFHELFASFEPDQKRIEKLKRLQKSASEEAASEEKTMRTFHSEPDLRDGRSQTCESLEDSSFHPTISVND